MKEVLTRNIPMKILSFLIAALVWVVVMNADDPYITKTIDDIPVTKENTEVIEENSKIYEVESGEYASIKIRGKRSVVEKLNASNFNAVADFKEMSIVKAIPIHISPKESSNYKSDDIEILSQTQMMTLTLEEADTQSFRVNVNTTGQTMDGYVVTGVAADPNIIWISGSKKQIAKIKEVVVEVSIQSYNDSFHIVTSPKALDENGYPVDATKLQFETKEISVDATVLPTKEIPIMVSIIGQPHPGYILTKRVFDPLSITIAGTQEDLDQIGYLSIPFDISLSKETQAGTLAIEDFLDEKYTLVDENANVVITASIGKQESKDIVIDTDAIQIANLAAAYTAVIHTPGTVTIRVMGTEEELKQLDDKTIKPTIDLSEFGTGTYSVTLDCDTPDGVTVRSAAVTVEISNK